MRDYQYKESGVEWLGAFPEHWSIEKLKNCIRLILSNVDKRTEKEESPVKLCNYVDVYYNDYIDLSLDFMKATANENELKKFQLKVGDVIITKDSEDPDDIAVPAYVKETENDLLCGYHLSILRSKNSGLSEEYLFWALKDYSIASQLHREATGVTRWAISSKHVKNAKIPFPPPSEQKAIADYLDTACQKIDRIITKKEKQIEKIEKYFNEKIFEITTKGLNPNVDLKEVESEWVGGIPEHWEKKKVKRMCKIFRGKFTHRPRNDPEYYGGVYPFIQTGNVTKASKYINDYSQTLNELGLSVSEMFPSGTLTMTIAANIADVAILNFDACFPDSVVGFKPNYNVDIEYLYYLFKALKQDFLSTAIVTTQMNLNIVRIGSVEGFVPPMEEQEEIVLEINTLFSKVEKINKNLKQQIKIIQEYKKSLIHECVTGKKQVFEGAINGVEKKALAAN